MVISSSFPVRGSIILLHFGHLMKWMWPGISIIPAKSYGYFEVTGVCSVSILICSKGVFWTWFLNMSRILDFSLRIMPSFIFAFSGLLFSGFLLLSELRIVCVCCFFLV